MEKHYRKFLDERNETEKARPPIGVDEESKFFFFFIRAFCIRNSKIQP